MRIFLHAMSRASSTYVAGKFREESLNTYWYDEPYHEMLEWLTPDVAKSFSSVTWESKHELEKPYFLEYIPLIKPGGGVKYFKPEFTHENYFPTGKLPIEEQKYLSYLNQHAESMGKIPVFAFIRSLAKVGQIRDFLPGVHIVQYKNPHQVLSSSQKAFARILDKRTDKKAKKPYHPGSLPSELQAFVAPSMKRFFEIFVISTVAGAFYADILFDVNKIAHDKSHRHKTEDLIYSYTKLRVNFDDIKVPDKEDSPVYDPRLLEQAIDKFIGSKDKINKFKNIIESISGVKVIQSLEVIEEMRSLFLEQYPSSSCITDVFKALDNVTSTKNKLAKQIETMRIELEEKEAQILTLPAFIGVLKNHTTKKLRHVIEKLRNKKIYNILRRGRSFFLR